ncbi:hypothetical protein IW145_003161 [Coemansia sp. RSA 521]|nr:hypothetical protein GGH15_003427 [Coemansia sp. RSA 562]KAJ2204855.1 hypothetical protein IW145_003161 [Coemansia sp. RSA 521]
MYLIAGRKRGSSTKGRPNTVPPRDPSPEPVPEFSGEFSGDVDASFDDADLLDPGLLGELEALRVEMGLPASDNMTSANALRHTAATTPHASRHTTADPAERTDPAELSHDYSDDDVDDVEATEADMNDPDLLHELSRVTGTAVEQPVVAKQPTINTQPTIKQPVIAKQPTIDEPLLRQLTARQAEFKQAALTAKRLRHMDVARDMLVQMKAVQTAAEAVGAGRPLPQGFVIPDKPVVVSVEQPALKVTQPPEPASVSQPTISKPAATTPKPVKATPQPVKATPQPVKATPQPVKATTPTTTHTTNAMPITHKSIATPDLTCSIASLEEQLHAQATEATRLAALFLRTGDKAKALDFHRRRKQAAADAATVATLAANGQAPPPILHSAVRWTEAAEQRRDIGAGQLQIRVERVFSAGDLSATLGSACDFYVQWTLPWPRDKASRGCTSTLRYRDFDAARGDLHVAYAHNIDMIDRRDTRPLVRWADRAKLTVELYKYMGLLWGSQLIGRAVMPLAALRTRTECSAVVEIEAVKGALSRPGRPLPGGPLFVDVAVSLRLPLSNQPETVEHEERWIYIDVQRMSQSHSGPEDVVSEPPKSVDVTSEPPKLVKEVGEQKEAIGASSKQPTPTEPTSKQSNAIESTSKQTTSTEPTSKQPEPNTKVQPVPEAATADITMDELEVQLDTMDGVVSNAVLELELAQIPARIKATGDADGHLQDLESSIQLRMTVVGALVGAGTLTIQMYMDSVASEMAQARRWALTAKRSGRNDLAVRALQRMKAMQSELSEMKAAMEAS